MILFKLKIIQFFNELEDIYRERHDWGYYNTFTENDYFDDKITERMMLSDYYETIFEDVDLENVDTEEYWYGNNELVSVKQVWDVTEEELLVLHKYGIINYKKGKNNGRV